MYRNELPDAVRYPASFRFQQPMNVPRAFAPAQSYCMRQPSYFPRRRLMSNRFASQRMRSFMEFARVNRPPILTDYQNSQNYHLNFSSQCRERYVPHIPAPFPQNIKTNVLPFSNSSFGNGVNKCIESPSPNEFSKNFKISDKLWVEAMTPNGQIYYYNTKSRATQWEKPANNNVMSLQHLKDISNSQNTFFPPLGQNKGTAVRPESFLENIPPVNQIVPGLLVFPPSSLCTRPPVFAPPSIEYKLQIPPQYSIHSAKIGSTYANNVYTNANCHDSTNSDFCTDDNSISIETVNANSLPLYESIPKSTQKLGSMPSITSKEKTENIAHKPNCNNIEVLNQEKSYETVGDKLSVSMEVNTKDNKLSEVNVAVGGRGHCIFDVKSKNDSDLAVLSKTENSGPKEIDRSRPVSSTPVPGSKWCVVWTGENRVFFYDAERKTSVWERPSELMDRHDVQKLIDAPPSIREVKEEDVIGGRSIKKIKVERDANSTAGIISNSDLVAEGNCHEMKAQEASKERISLPYVTRVKLFREMLAEKNVSAFSTWEKELHKIEFDSRYLLLTSKERKQKFELYIQEKLDEEKNIRKKETQDLWKNFNSLLQEASVTSKTRFLDFTHRYKNDPRFKAVEKWKDREFLFNDFIKSEKKAEVHADESTKKFLQLLREQIYINKWSKWSDVSKNISNDDRYKAVSNGNGEKIFKEYLRQHILEEINATKDKDLRVSTSIQNRKEEVKKDLFIPLKEREKEQELHKYKSSLDCYRALLIDLVRNPNIAWSEAKKILKDDVRWDSVRELHYDEHEYFFNKHISYLLSKKREQFHQMLNEISEISLNSSWKDVQNVILNDSRCKFFSKDVKICEKEFYEYMKDRTKIAIEAFKELLKETKTIMYYSKDLLRSRDHIQNIEMILSNDKRYLDLECMKREREEILLSYIERSMKVQHYHQ